MNRPATLQKGPKGSGADSTSGHAIERSIPSCRGLYLGGVVWGLFVNV